MKQDGTQNDIFTSYVLLIIRCCKLLEASINWSVYIALHTDTFVSEASGVIRTFMSMRQNYENVDCDIAVH